MLHEFAIADTCFLIDWARFRRRDIIFKVFRTVFIPESVIREVVSENTISWISKWLAKRGLSLYTESADELEEARLLVVRTRRIPQIIPVDVPETLCLVVGRKYGYVVLTENRGAIMATEVIEELSNVKVWRSLELLVEAVKSGVLKVDCDNPEKVFREYMEDTLHIFPRNDYSKAVAEVVRICKKRR